MSKPLRNQNLSKKITHKLLPKFFIGQRKINAFIIKRVIKSHTMYKEFNAHIA